MNESVATTRDIRVTTDARFKAYVVEQYPDNPHLWECDSCAYGATPGYINKAWAEAEAEANVRNQALITAEVEGLPSGDVTILPEDKPRSAEAEAELLGATPEQRAKLRAIVTARIVAERRVEELNREVQRLTNEQVEPNDRRVWGLFGRAAAEADRQGYCNVYDQISEAVNIPNREELRSSGYLPARRYDVEVTLNLSVIVSVTIEANDEEDADEQVSRMSNADIWEEVSGQVELDRYAIDSFSTGEVNEVDD